MVTKSISIADRKVTSIYCNPLIWKAFMKKCRVSGQSTCHVLEAFMWAFTQAIPDTPVTTLPKVEVNLMVNRVVERVHRITRVGAWNGKLLDHGVER